MMKNERATIDFDTWWADENDGAYYSDEYYVAKRVWLAAYDMYEPYKSQDKELELIAALGSVHPLHAPGHIPCSACAALGRKE